MIELLHCDCMEYMATVPDKYFDLAIVDARVRSVTKIERIWPWMTFYFWTTLIFQSTI